MGLEALVVAQIERIEDRVDRMTVAFLDGGKDRGNTDDGAAVILDRVDRGENRLAGRDGSRQDQDVLVVDHLHEVIAEDHLTAADILRADDVDRLVGVEVDVVVVRQLTRHACADDLGAVQTEDGVDNGVRAVGKDHLLGDSFCLGETGFLGGHVDVIIGVAVHGREVAFFDAEKDVFVFGSDLIFFGHSGTSANNNLLYSTIFLCNLQEKPLKVVPFIQEYFGLILGEK